MITSTHYVTQDDSKAQLATQGGNRESARTGKRKFLATDSSFIDVVERCARRDQKREPFAVLVDAVRCCSLGQITGTLFEVGGQYRRNR